MLKYALHHDINAGALLSPYVTSTAVLMQHVMVATYHNHGPVMCCCTATGKDSKLRL